jgi:hypothetical protein
MLKRILLATAILFVAVIAFAQEAAPALPMGADETQKLVIGVFAVVLPFLVGMLRKLKPTMPRLLVWSLPAILGMLGTWAVSYFSGSVNPWSGALSGMIAVALHELRTTYADHGING